MPATKEEAWDEWFHVPQIIDGRFAVVVCFESKRQQFYAIQYWTPAQIFNGYRVSEEGIRFNVVPPIDPRAGL